MVDKKLSSVHYSLSAQKPLKCSFVYRKRGNKAFDNMRSHSTLLRCFAQSGVTSVEKMPRFPLIGMAR